MSLFLSPFFDSVAEAAMPRTNGPGYMQWTIIGTSSFSVLFPAHPLPYVGRTEHCAAFRLTGSEEAHDLRVHESHLVEVQYNPRAAALHLRRQLLKMLCLQVANQPDRCLVPVRI